MGLVGLVERRLPIDWLNFVHFHITDLDENKNQYDAYVIECHPECHINAASESDDDIVLIETHIHITSGTISGCAAGLLRYLRDVCKVDMYWSGSTLDAIPRYPRSFTSIIKGHSFIKWRYYLNVCTFSYSMVWWTWVDWERELDWMALHGINLALALTGQEYLYEKTYVKLGLPREDLDSFFAGPAFLAWARMGNIQSTWTGRSLPKIWIDEQWQLQLKIVKRMRELGIRPILPAFAGFVPKTIKKIFPDAHVLPSTIWNRFPEENSAVAHLYPATNEFQTIARTFLDIQTEELDDDPGGTFYSIDLYNELIPASMNNEYLRNSTCGVVESIRREGQTNVWIMQGWMFAYEKDKVWTREKINALLSGASDDEMIILDLFSESQPYWNTYGTKTWIWCLLHNFGGNMGLFGELDIMDRNPRFTNKTMQGIGLTMEGIFQNEFVYHFMLDVPFRDQVTSQKQWVKDFTFRRYQCWHPDVDVAWEILANNIYTNPYHKTIHTVNKSIYEFRPNDSGLAGNTGDHPTVLHYHPEMMVKALRLLLRAARNNKKLRESPMYQYDLVDVGRQVFANAFLFLYKAFIHKRNHHIGKHLLDLLVDIDRLLMTNRHFLIATWIRNARTLAKNDEGLADFYEREARNQITVWGPQGQNVDYASKQWGGLVKSFFLPRWRIFIEHYLSTSWNRETYLKAVIAFETDWQMEKWDDFDVTMSCTSDKILDEMLTKWSSWVTTVN